MIKKSHVQNIIRYNNNIIINSQSGLIKKQFVNRIKCMPYVKMQVIFSESNL